MAKNRTLNPSQVELTSRPLNKANPDLVHRVLGNPDLYPDEMKAWLPRFLNTNVNLQLQSVQLPKPESARSVGVSGEAQFQNGWSGPTAEYYRDPYSRVHLGGTVTGGTPGATIFTLPIGFRPKATQTFPVVSAGAFGVCTVNPNGDVVATTGANTSFNLAGVSFRSYA